jgi:hypothetical protein
LSQAATLKGPARDAVLSYLGTMSQAQLDTLSATAAAAGFATEVIRLPDGKTVKVAVDPETGKIIDTKTLLDSITDKHVKFTVDGDIDPVSGKITQAVTLADGARGTMTVDANPDPATGKINGTVTYGNGQTAMVSIDGNQEPANGKINATVTFANGQTAVIPIDAEPSQAANKIAGLRTSASAKVTFPTDTDTGPARGGVNAVHGQARRPQSFNTDSNTGPARGAVDGVHSVARLKQSFDTDSRTDPARTQVNRVQGEARRPQNFPTDSNVGAARGNVNSVQGDARRPQSFNVDARTESAATKLGNLVREYANRTFTWIVNIINRVFGHDGTVYPATGYADGGNRDVGGTPMTARRTASGMEGPGGRRLNWASNRRASIARPNSWRVFGDRADVDEFFLPDNSAPFTMALGAEWANRRGMILVPKERLTRMASGGMVRVEDGTQVPRSFFDKVSPKYARAYGPAASGGGGSLGTLGISVRRMATGGVVAGRTSLPFAGGRTAGLDLRSVVAEVRALRGDIGQLEPKVYAPTINNPVAEPASATVASNLRTGALLRAL